MLCPSCQNELPLSAAADGTCVRCGYLLERADIEAWLAELEGDDGGNYYLRQTLDDIHLTFVQRETIEGTWVEPSAEDASEDAPSDNIPTLDLPNDPLRTFDPELRRTADGGLSLDAPWSLDEVNEAVQQEPPPQHDESVRQEPHPPKDEVNLGATIESGWFPPVASDEFTLNQETSDDETARQEPRPPNNLDAGDAVNLGAMIDSGSFPPISPDALDSSNLGATIESHSFPALDSQYGEGFSFEGIDPADPKSKQTLQELPDDPKKTAANLQTIQLPLGDPGTTLDSAALDSATQFMLGRVRTGAADDDDEDNDEGTFNERRMAATLDSASLTDSQGAALARIWRGTISPDTTTRTSIKRDATGSPRDSKLVIKPKAFVTNPTPDIPMKTGADYELLNVIGEGGVGIVYAARQASIDRTVALKMLKPAGAKSADQREKFLSEAVVTADLDHPNIVPIYELGSNEAGALFYSMKKVQGTPWSKVIGDKPLHENLEILLKVADAVGFGHARGVIHRDLKPENVMLGEYGEVLVMDWGLAIATPLFRKSATITQTTSMGGTPAYMAPEMAAGPVEKVGPQSDVYLLGAILFEILTGQPPHSGKTVMKCLMAAARNEIVKSAVSGELHEIALRSMASRISERPQTVKDFQAAIREYQSHSESLALLQRAEDRLQAARLSKDYEELSRSVFEYDEAVELWEGNTRAKQGGLLARLAYAEIARERDDLELADSILLIGEPTHAAFKQQLQHEIAEEKARRRRLRAARRIMLAMAAVIALVITGGLIWVNHERGQAVIARDEAEQQKLKADEQRIKAEEATKQEAAAKRDAVAQKEVAEGERQRAEEQRMKAEQSAKLEAAAKVEEQKAREQAVAQKEVADKLRIKAEEQTRLAENAAKLEADAKMKEQKARELAELAQDTAEAAKKAEEYVAYVARIGLAAAKVEENAFGDVAALLDECPPALRNWEWGRLRYLCGRADATVDASSQIEAVAVSPTSERWAAGGQDGKVRVWQRDDLKKQPLVIPFGSHVQALAWSPDGKTLAVGGLHPDGKVLRLFDAQSGEPRGDLGGHTDGVLSVRFNAAGTQLLSSGYDHTARIWDLKTNKELRALRGHSWWVWSAEWSPDERAVVTAGQDGKCIVWDLASTNNDKPETLALFTGHTGPVYAAGWSPDGQRIASAGYDQRVLVWDRTQAKPFPFEKLTANAAVPAPVYLPLVGHHGPVRSVKFFPDNTGRGGKDLVLSTSQDNTVRIWDAASGKTIQTLRGHSGRVSNAAFVDGGQRILSASHDRLLKLWNLAGYEEVRVLRGQLLAGHADAILGANFSRDGKQVVTASRDRSAKVWNTADGALVATLAEGHDFLATTIVLFPDHKRFATAALDNTTRIWEIASGVEQFRLNDTGRAAVVAISSSGEWLVTGSTESKAQVWDASTGNIRHDLPGHRGEVTAAAWSPNDRLLATADSGGRIRVWEPAAGKIVWTADRHSSGVTALAFSADGQWLYSASNDQTVGCARAENGKEDLQRIWKHPAGVAAMVLSDDGKLALTYAADNTVRVWDPAVTRITGTLTGIAGRVTGIALSADKRRALVVSTIEEKAGAILPAPREEQADPAKRQAPKDTDQEKKSSGQHTVAQFFDVATGKEVPDSRLSGAGLLWSGCFVTPDRVLTVGGNSARLWDTAKRETLMNFQQHGAVAAVDFSPNGKQLLTGSLDTTAKLWDIATARAVRKLPLEHTGAINAALFSPNGEELLTVSDDRTAIIWDAAKLTVKQQIGLGGERLRAGVWLPDGLRVALAGDDSLARIFDVKTGALVHELAGHDAPITSIAVSGDGRWLATGCEDNKIRLWDTATGQARGELTGHTASVTSVDLSPDGARVVTGSADTTAKIWDTRTRKEILTLNGHTQEVTAVRFSRDGRQVLTASRDGTAILWLADEWKE
jgi:WD40 repeat protein/serine/threonine protein kinase